MQDHLRSAYRDFPLSLNVAFERTQPPALLPIWWREVGGLEAAGVWVVYCPSWLILSSCLLPVHHWIELPPHTESTDR